MIDRILNEFIQVFFPKAANILHFGSSMHTNEFNDVDLLIFSSNISSFTKEIFSFKETTFEVIIIPKKKLFQILELDKEYGIYLSIIEKGTIIVDRDNTLKELKKIITDKKLSPSPILRKYNIEYDLKENLNYLKSAKESNEIELLLSSIIENLIDLKLLNYGVISAKKTRHKYKEISIKNNIFLSEILYIKNAYLENLCYLEFTESINKLISIEGVVNKNYLSNQYFLNNIYNEELIIHIKTEKDENYFFENLLPLLKSSLSTKEYYFFEISKDSMSLLEKGIYLVICESNEILKKMALELRELIDKNFNLETAYFTYPYQLDISSFLGIFDSSDYTDFTNILKNISSFIAQNYVQEHTRVLWFMNFYIGSYISSGIDKKQFIEEFKELGMGLGHSFLNDKKDNLSQKNYLLNKSKNKFFEDLEVTKVIFSTHINLTSNWNLKYLPDSKINFLLETNKIGSLNKVRRNDLIAFLSKVFLIKSMNFVFTLHQIGLLLENDYEN